MTGNPSLDGSNMTGNPSFNGSNITTINGSNITTGVIQSANWSSAGTQISLTDGTINTGGTSSPKFQVASDGSVDLNGATLDGGTITGTLMQSAFAEGDVDFVTEALNIDSGAYQQVTVNGVRRLLCNRVCDNVFQEFALNSEQGANTFHTKPLNIWQYNDEGPVYPSTSLLNLNRVAGPASSTKVTVNMSSFPIISYDWFNKNEVPKEEERFAVRFRIENTAYHFYFQAGVRVDDGGGGDGGECEIGFWPISVADWNTIVASSSTDPTLAGGFTYNILNHDGTGGIDEGDYSDANTTTVSCGSYTFVCWGYIRHEQEGTDNTLIASLRIYMTGTGAGMEDGTSTAERVGVDLKKVHNGDYIVDRSVIMPEGFFRVYN